MTVVSVVAGGWSFRGDGWLERSESLPGTVIGVNDAGLLLVRCDEIVSMDRLWTEGRWTAMCRLRRQAWIRVAALKRKTEQETIDNVDWLRMFACDNMSVKLSDDDVSIHGTNSGVCGVGRAWKHRPKEIYLFGFDMQPGPGGQAHWYPQYEWQPKTKGRRTDWAKEFNLIAHQFQERGVRVYNASSRSLITSFPRVTPSDLKLGEAG